MYKHKTAAVQAALRSAIVASAGTLIAVGAWADFVINDDLIVDGSACVGVDCVNGESFGFDTIRIKENNLRIRAQDTSNSASFPTNDWQITFNESSNGGQNKFSIDDIDNGRIPFTIEANSPSHSLYVDSSKRIGFGTSTPVVELHVVDGDTPTLRLEQNGSSGFTPQTWDVAGNETNFFIRDATNSSRLPLRIRPSAPSNSIFVDTDGDVGLGTSSPEAGLDIRGDMKLKNSGTGDPGLPRIRMTNDDAAAATDHPEWNIDVTDTGRLRFSAQGSGASELELHGKTGACLQLRDSDEGGTSRLTVLDGVATWAQGACPN